MVSAVFDGYYNIGMERSIVGLTRVPERSIR